MRSYAALLILLILGVSWLGITAWDDFEEYEYAVAESYDGLHEFPDGMMVDLDEDAVEDAARSMTPLVHPRARRLRRNIFRHSPQYGTVLGDIYHNYRPYFYHFDRVRVELYHKSVDGSERFLGTSTTGSTGHYSISYKWRQADPELRRPNLFIRSYLLRYGRFVPLYTSPVYERQYPGDFLQLNIDLSKCRNCGQTIHSYSNIEAGGFGAEGAAAAYSAARANPTGDESAPGPDITVGPTIGATVGIAAGPPVGEQRPLPRTGPGAYRPGSGALFGGRNQPGPGPTGPPPPAAGGRVIPTAPSATPAAAPAAGDRAIPTPVAESVLANAAASGAQSTGATPGGDASDLEL